VKNLAMTTGTGVACSCWHSTPTLVNCTFIDNGPLNPSEFSFAGAIHNLNGAPVMIDCRFINNRGGQGGAFSTWESGPDPAHHPLFIRCTFRDNIAYSGGAIANLRSNPTLIDCVFENNTALVSGGAIYNDGFDEPDFWISRPVLENCTFRNNIAKINGGAIFNEGSSESTLTACMLTGNTAASGGAIMNNAASFSTLTDSTACANLPDQIAGTWHDQGGNLITHECDDPCREDLNGDDAVDGSDLSILLGNWNQSNSDADINQDGMIDGADLTILLGAWGACP
jgi:predicted outer membrane repeat protein